MWVRDLEWSRTHIDQGFWSAMRRSLKASVGLLLVAGSLATPATASTASMLVVAGARTASVDLTLRAGTSFDLRRIKIESGGRYAGFYAESLDVQGDKRAEAGARVGLVQLRDFHEPGAPGVIWSFGGAHENSLRPGRYRLYLIADGYTRVSVPVTGQAIGVLHPSRRTVAAAAVRTDVLTSPLQAHNVQPLAVSGARSISLSAVLVGRFRAYAGTIGACLHSPGGACGEYGNAVDGPWAGYVLSPLADLTMVWAVQYEAGLVKPGRLEAQQDALNATTISYASGAAFTLALN